MNMLNRLKSGYYFALFNASNFGCTVINLLTMANYQNYHFYSTINYIYIYIYNSCTIFLLLLFKFQYFPIR